MKFRQQLCLFLLFLASILQATAAFAQSSPPAQRSQNTRRAGQADSSLDTGAVTHGVYRNKTLGFTCKIPQGWVLRTEEMNAPSNPTAEAKENRAAPDRITDHPAPKPGASGTPTGGGCPLKCGKVLLAAFSRPPEARGEEVNASIVIAVESVDAYPGLKEAVQYFEPLTEVAKAQGFKVDEEPYEIAIGTKKLVREDFHKDVGTRVMRQCTMAMIAHGYAVSFTVIAGTEDDLEEFIDGMDFEEGKPSTK